VAGWWAGGPQRSDLQPPCVPLPLSRGEEEGQESSQQGGPRGCWVRRLTAVLLGRSASWPAWRTSRTSADVPGALRQKRAEVCTIKNYSPRAGGQRASDGCVQCTEGPTIFLFMKGVSCAMCQQGVPRAATVARKKKKRRKKTTTTCLALALVSFLKKRRRSARQAVGAHHK